MPVEADTITKGLVLAKDEKYPDCIYVEIQFASEIRLDEWPSIHRQLQKRYSANFPYNLRERILDFPRTYGFLGIKGVKRRLAQYHSLPEEDEK